AWFDAPRRGAAGATAAQLFATRGSETSVVDDTIVSVFWSVPQLVVVGRGPIAEALAKAATLLGWQPQIVDEVPTATGLIAQLSTSDNLVVAAHDVDVAGAALAAALDSDVGYIGALGARRMQQPRADWLAYRDITDLSRVHGPAGIDIGADTPAEIALSRLAEAAAVTAGTAERDAM